MKVRTRRKYITRVRSFRDAKDFTSNFHFRGQITKSMKLSNLKTMKISMQQFLKFMCNN